MLFRQIFDGVSSTYTYLLASRPGGEALIIDPVRDKVDHYLRLVRELDLQLVKAVDTHVHADHITGLGALRDATHCVTVMGRKSGVDVVSMRVDEGDRITIEGLELDVLYTPGHTDDSYCFVMPDRVFTGDTLLIRGTGRTDFQNGSPEAAYDSLFNKVLKLPDETMVYPAHDYKGDTVSTIGEEKRFNPRLQVRSVDEYVEIMENLNLPDPRMMDVAVPANKQIGFANDDPDLRAATLSVRDGIGYLNDGKTVFVDLREDGERERDGSIPGAVHLPYSRLRGESGADGMLRTLAEDADTDRVLLFCAYGERSALALQDLRKAGVPKVCHLAGGIDAWSKENGPLEKPVSS